MKNPKNWIQIALIIAVFFGIRACQQQDLASGQVPSIQAATISGSVINTADFTGKPYLLVFWGTWCPVCEAELDVYQALSQDYTLVTVAMSSGSDQELNAYQTKHGIDFTVINDETGTWSKQFGVQAVPALFLIDENGEIAFRELGYTTEWGVRLRMWWTGA